MKKISLFLLGTISLFSGEFRYGYGDMTFNGGFLGFSQSVTEHIDTYSYEESHKNMLDSKWFYAYSITWYNSEHFQQMQSTYNNTVNTIANNFFFSTPADSSVFIPTMDYQLKGFDGSLSVGYDVYHKDENNYLGLAGYLGIDFPTIDSAKSDSYTTTLPSGVDQDLLEKYFLPSQTDITTYKIGIGFYGRKAIMPMLSLYANGIIAYQRGSVSNDYADSDFSVNGSYGALDVGLRFQPLEDNYEVLGITWSPRVYLTAGYKLERWQLDDVAIDISGMGIQMAPTDMSIDTDIVYFGIGYSF